MQPAAQIVLERCNWDQTSKTLQEMRQVDEYLIAAVREGLTVAFWVIDHLKLLRWLAMPLPVESALARSRDLGGRGI